jgi:hypothetical protein
MISEEAVNAYNSRLTVDLSQPSKWTTSQKDQVRHYGSLAENLLKNRDFAMFVHHFKFTIADELSNIRGHTAEENAQRIAFSHQLSGIDSFVNSLKRAVYLKNRVGNAEAPDA